MSSPIDPIRRAAQARRARKAKADGVKGERKAEASFLPVPVGAARTVPPPSGEPKGGAVFTAQLIGQDGEKRGLRAGATAIDKAKDSYNKTEWSGAKDRRARKGGVTKTDV